MPGRHTPSRCRRSICRAQLASADYPGLLPDGGLCRDGRSRSGAGAGITGRPNSDRYRRLALLVDTMFDKVAQLQQIQRSIRKWKRNGATGDGVRLGPASRPRRNGSTATRRRAGQGCRLYRRSGRRPPNSAAPRTPPTAALAPQDRDPLYREFLNGAPAARTKAHPRRCIRPARVTGLTKRRPAFAGRRVYSFSSEGAVGRKRQKELMSWLFPLPGMRHPAISSSMTKPSARPATCPRRRGARERMASMPVMQGTVTYKISVSAWLSQRTRHVPAPPRQKIRRKLHVGSATLGHQDSRI